MSEAIWKFENPKSAHRRGKSIAVRKPSRSCSGLARPSLAIPEFRGHEEHLDAMLADLDVPFIRTTDALVREEMQGRRLYHYYDGHMNAAGYKLWTSVVRPILMAGEKK